MTGDLRLGEKGAEKTNPGALELKKCRPSLRKYDFCKVLFTINLVINF
ncbi:MAG: hypothetical protein ACQEQO_01905 [Thermodesulfobacteriota bacterium]